MNINNSDEHISKSKNCFTWVSRRWDRTVFLQNINIHCLSSNLVHHQMITNNINNFCETFLKTLNIYSEGQVLTKRRSSWPWRSGQPSTSSSVKFQCQIPEFQLWLWWPCLDLFVKLYYSVWCWPDYYYVCF